MQRRTRDIFADRDDGAPLRELGAELHVFFEALRQAVEAFGDRLARAERQRLGAGVDLDARHHALLLEEPVANGVPSYAFWRMRLVVEDDAADVLAECLVVREQHVAVGAAVLLGVLDLDALEALLDRAGAFVGGENASAGGYEALSDGSEILCWHRVSCSGVA